MANTMSNHNAPQPPRSLVKQHSWSPDMNRDQAWLRKKKKPPMDLIRRSKSVTNDDIEELKGCFELGFGFETESPDLNPRLSHTIPALDLYCAVRRQYSNHLSRTSSFASEHEGSNNSNSTTTIVDKGDDKKTMKQKLKQWAKVVGFSVRHSSGKQ
ncbi:hypothetical protein CARUB_v10015804mg [Capsella rubella]|uniref:DUF1685 domain-containing protein n=1 Tax=Capsella rubella TaxID=81985 RepID=R0I7U1_9BRAS|nr:uncharacterized protein LOC17892106 [Capsella rubella]EOA32523.1 hypothetical protein CARUB_v10015804mg [Capsella rubella]